MADGVLMQTWSGRIRRDPLNACFWVSVWALLPVMLYLSFDFGVTVDEPLAGVYGRMVLNYWLSGFADQSAKSYHDYIFLGAMHDVIGAMLIDAVKALKLNGLFRHEYEIRHLLLSTYGWIAIFYAARLGKRLFGLRGGVLVLLFMVLSPKFIGHAMNNTKDIPFAAAWAFTLFQLSGVRRAYPYVTPGLGARIVLGVSAALNLRSGGIMLLGFSGAYLAAVVALDSARPRAARLRWAASRLSAGTVASLCLGTLCWPWAMENPILRPVQALLLMANFSIYQDGTLFEGVRMHATKVPWYFILKWHAITTPLGVLAGFWASPLLVLRSRSRMMTAFLLVVVLVPASMVMILGSPLYHDGRHFLFLYPAIAVLAAGAWSWAFEAIGRLFSFEHRRSHACAVLAVLFIAGFYDAIRFHVVNHPNQAVYFNQLIGGVRGAFLKYDQDFWMNCKKQAEEWVLAMQRMGANRDIKYEIRTMTGGPGSMIDGITKGVTAHSITVDSVPVCVIKIDEKTIGIPPR